MFTNRFEISHPSDPAITAAFGFDHAVGFFVDIMHSDNSDNNTKSYSAIDRGYDNKRPLWGALVFLVEAGFYAKDDLHDAMGALQDGKVDGLPERINAVADIVMKFKRAAD